MKKLMLFLTITGMYAASLWSQGFQQTDRGLNTVINNMHIELQFYTPSVIRVIKYPENKSFTKESLSVIMTQQPVKFKIKDQGKTVQLKTEKLLVSLNLESGTILFSKADSKYLLKEKDEGYRFTDFNDAGSPTYTISQEFLLDADEAIYGLGQQQQGKMVQRNLKLRMIQGNTDDYIPFFQSVKGYGVFWDNYSPTLFEDSPKSTVFTSDVGDGIDYYFMYGGNADGVIACMRELTGEVPMFPLWTFGYWQSKERYKTQDELVDVVRKYRELQVPLDGIIQDWQYWGNNYLWNAMEFLNADFYDPQKMINDVHGLNAHMIISIWNSFGPQTKPYKELEEIRALMDFKTWPESGSEKWPPNPDYPSGVRVYDPYNPAARDIYWKYLSKGIFSIGMDGWWMDSSEPDHLQFKPSDFDNKTWLGSFRKVRNAFPLMTVGGLSEHQRSVSSDKRVFILTRSAFAGQQRYGANTWSGDVVSSWNALRNQISAGLNFSLCGIPYWNSDIGGFFLWDFKNPLRNAEYRELYARWIQFGTFCPMMRSHGTDAPREIYQFGQKGDKIYDAIEKYIRLRYSLLPYIYASSHQVSVNHSSMMRALVMDFTNDKLALDLNNEYMFGSSLLVCPVTVPMYSKKAVRGSDSFMEEDYSTIRETEVYLPQGSDWYDFWTGSRFTGGQKIQKEVPLDIIPLYVKSGSILPFGPDVQYATEKKWDNLTLRIYAGADGTFTLYEDENDNYNYEKGIFSTIPFYWNDKSKTLTIGDRKGSFPGMLAERIFHIVLVNEKNGTGVDSANEFIITVHYEGKRMNIPIK